MRIKPDMSNYGAVVISSEKYDGRLGYGYDFRIGDMVPDTEAAVVVFWGQPPMSTFLSDIEDKTGGKVNVAQSGLWDSFVYFSKKIEDPQVINNSYKNNLVKKPAESASR